ncbi:MAG: discoidin domain-containing protein, partial [Candidatus Binatia bacterium]
ATAGEGDASVMLDDDASTVWRSSPGPGEVAVTLDFHEAVEQGGLFVEHAAGAFASAYVVETSLDGAQWEEARRFTDSDGGMDPVYLPETYSRYLRLRFAPTAGRQVAIGEIRVQPFEVSASPNGFFGAIARRAAPGLYPRYFSGEQSYWTVVGTSGDDHEALMNEEGSVEVAAGGFTLEPFVYRDGDLEVAVTAFASGRPGASTLYVRYRLRSGSVVQGLRFFVALRPFQVLPPWQTLNRTGGVARLSSLSIRHDTVRADQRRVVALTKPSGFGAARFEEGDVTGFLARGTLPRSSWVDDPFGHASAALSWNLDLEAGQARDVWIAVPWTERSPVARASRRAADKPVGEADPSLEAVLEQVRRAWRFEVDRVAIELPPAAADWAASLRSNLAYILVNRDGAAIQPGSRTYERSWIRDGAMTSGALLELGLDEEVKSYLRWFAPYVGDDGWVPCCVDARGADPVPEHDSFGEFIWAVAEVWRFTRDEGFVKELWPKVSAAADHMSRLRAKRMTPEYQEPAGRAYFGLLPESISHEGYSARPVHSYWDQAFALRGFADAAMLAAVVGDAEAAVRFAAETDAFATALRESIAAVTAERSLQVAPASVELGDFDPTSTAVSFLLGTEGVYVREDLGRSFEKYMADLRARRGKAARGVGYTAYELRNATALVLLGLKAEAVEMLGELVADQRPPAWNQWPEITWLFPKEPSFLGDLPHTWIGSTFVHAVRTLLVAEREVIPTGQGKAAPPSLLVGAGIALAWLDGGEVRGRGLPTWYGHLSLRIRAENAATGSVKAGRRVVVELESGAADAATAESRLQAIASNSPRSSPPRDFAMPEGGIQVAAPFGVPVSAATMDGVPASLEGDAVHVRRLPATVLFEYKTRLENPR